MQAIQTHNLWTSLNSLRKSCMISGGRRYKHTTCEPHSTVSERAVWSVEADDTNIHLVNLTQQSQKEVYDQWRQTIQTYNLWTSLNSLRKSCMISGGRRHKHTTCKPHSTVSGRAVWSVEADDTNIQLVNLTQQSQKELYDQWRQTIQTYNLWTSLNSLRQSCMISGGRRHKHTTCKPHSTVSGRAVWSVEADDTNIQLVNLTLQSQAELYDQWRQTIQTHNLWTSLCSLRQSCMISGGRRYKHTTCEPHSTVSERAVWSVEADDTNIQLVNLTQQSQKELYDQWRQTIQTYNLWTSLYRLRQSCMISGGRRYKHITCEPHSTVSDRAVWSVEADDTNTQLVNLTLPSQTELELYDQWRQTIQTHNLWTSLYSLRQSCMISGGKRYKHTTCEPHSTVSDRAVWSVEADDTNIQLVNLTLQSQTKLYDQWRQTIQTYNLWTSLNSLRKSCMISGGRRHKHTTCKPHSTVSGRALWSVEADDTNIQLVNLTLQSQAELYDQWRQTIQTYNLWTSFYSLRQSCMISGGRRYKHTTCEPHSAVSDKAVWSVEADDTNIQLVNLTQQSERAVWSVEADDTNIHLVNLTQQSQKELYDQWRQTIQTYNLWTSLNSLRKSCMISGGRRYKHTTCEPHSTVSERAVWSVEADDTNTQLVNLTLPSQTDLELYDQWRQTIQTHNLWTSLYSLRQSCMISGGRRYKHTTCEPHSTVSDRDVWSVEADDTNIQLVNLILQSQTEIYEQWRQKIQTYNLWTSPYSLRQSCMISGGRRYKHITCEPHSSVSDRAVWSVEADDTNIQLVNLTLQSQTAVWTVEADYTNIQPVNLTLQSQTELYHQWRQTIQTYNLWTSFCSYRQLHDQWRQTIQTYNLWTSLCSLRQSCMISGGRRYKHTTCEPHSAVTDSCMISGGRRYKHTTCEPHSTVSDRAVWSVEADDTNT